VRDAWSDSEQDVMPLLHWNWYRPHELKSLRENVMGAIAAGLPGCCGTVVKQTMLLLLWRGAVATTAAAAVLAVMLLPAAAAMLLPATPGPAELNTLQLQTCNRTKQTRAASEREGRLPEVMQQAWIGRCKSKQVVFRLQKLLFRRLLVSSFP
jgi:hypothetical protein